MSGSRILVETWAVFDTHRFGGSSRRGRGDRHERKMANLSIMAQPSIYRFHPPASLREPILLFPNDKQGSVLAKNNCSWIRDKTQNYSTMSTYRCRLQQLHAVAPAAPAVMTALDDLFEFICEGPLLEDLGLTPDMVESSIDKWLVCCRYLCRLFGLNELFMSSSEKIRIFHYYIPVFLWCEEQLAQHQALFKDGEGIPPLVIGVSAPQGSGKTTLVFGLDYLFRVTGRNPVSISIDDFYLTAEDQAKLGRENPGNSLLELRGNAGSHDLQLSIDTLTSLRGLTREGLKMKVPRYDKSAYNGKGDRADPSTWPEVEGPLSVVLLEGWMLGFKPLPNEVVKAIDPQLEIVNKNLEAYYDAWDKFIDSWLIIKVDDPRCVFNWRLQAEKAMKADGKPGMSDEEVMDFVSRYMPAYKAYLPTLYSEGPKSSNPKRLVVEIDSGRNPICCTWSY